MKYQKDAVMRDAQRFLKRTSLYQENRDLGFAVDHVLFDPVANRYHAWACNELGDVYFFNPYGCGEPVLRTDHNFKRDLFDRLQDGWKLVDMTMDCHRCVWADIEEVHDSGEALSPGVQKYLRYCKHNGITHARLRDGNEWIMQNTMRLYDRKAAKTTHRHDPER